MHLKLFAFCYLIIITISSSQSNDSPGFFLKISKNIPRLGRRSNSPISDFEKFFLKASKSVPRIGRRDESIMDTNIPEEILINRWYDKFMMKSPIKRYSQAENMLMMMDAKNNNNNNNNMKKGKSYALVQPVDSNFIIELISNDDLSPNDLKFISWKDLDMALQNDEILLEKLMVLGKADHEMTDEFSNHNYQMEHFMPLITGGGANRFANSNPNKNAFTRNDYYKTTKK